QFAAATTVTEALSAKVAPLAEGVLKAMMMNKLTTAVTVLLLASLIGFGGGGLPSQMAAGQQVQPPAVSLRKARDERYTEESVTPTSKAVAPQPFPALMHLAIKDKEALTVILENGKLIIEPGTKVRLTPVKTEKGNCVRLEWPGAVAEALRMKIETSTQILEFEGAPGGVFTARNLQQGTLDLKEKKRPDLSGTQFPVVPETKKPDPGQKKTDQSTPEVRILKGHSAAVYFAAFSPNGETLVTAAKGFTKSPRTDEVIIWDVTAQKAKHTIQFKAPPDTVPLWSMTLSA